MRLSGIPFFTHRPGVDGGAYVLVYKLHGRYIVSCRPAQPVYIRLEFDDEQDAVNKALAFGDEFNIPVRRLRTYAERRLIDRIREWVAVPPIPWFR